MCVDEMRCALLFLLCIVINVFPLSTHAEACPGYSQWQEWSRWGPCSATCGRGVRARSRVCLAKKTETKCRGHSSVLQKCVLRPCQAMFPGFAYPNFGSDNVAAVPANAPSAAGGEANGGADPGYLSSMYASLAGLWAGGGGQAAAEPPKPPVGVPQYRGMYYPPQHSYTWGNWGQWSDCSRECEGRRTRSRICIDITRKTPVKALSKHCGGGRMRQTTACGPKCKPPMAYAGFGGMAGAAAMRQAIIQAQEAGGAQPEAEESQGEHVGAVLEQEGKRGPVMVGDVQPGDERSMTGVAPGFAWPVAEPEEEESELNLSAETIIFIVIFLLFLVLLITAICIWFIQRSREATLKQKLKDALPFYKQDEDDDDGGKGASGLVKPAYKWDKCDRMGPGGANQGWPDQQRKDTVGWSDQQHKDTIGANQGWPDQQHKDTIGGVNQPQPHIASYAQPPPGEFPTNEEPSVPLTSLEDMPRQSSEGKLDIPGTPSATTREKFHRPGTPRPSVEEDEISDAPIQSMEENPDAFVIPEENTEEKSDAIEGKEEMSDAAVVPEEHMEENSDNLVFPEESKEGTSDDPGLAQGDSEGHGDAPVIAEETEEEKHVSLDVPEDEKENADTPKEEPITKARPSKANRPKASLSKANPPKTSPSKARTSKANPPKASPSKAKPSKATPPKANLLKAVKEKQAATSSSQPSDKAPESDQPMSSGSTKPEDMSSSALSEPEPEPYYITPVRLHTQQGTPRRPKVHFSSDTKGSAKDVYNKGVMEQTMGMWLGLPPPENKKPGEEDGNKSDNMSDEDRVYVSSNISDVAQRLKFSTKSVFRDKRSKVRAQTGHLEIQKRIEEEDEYSGDGDVSNLSSQYNWPVRSVQPWSARDIEKNSMEWDKSKEIRKYSKLKLSGDAPDTHFSRAELLKKSRKFTTPDISPTLEESSSDLFVPKGIVKLKQAKKPYVAFAPHYSPEFYKHMLEKKRKFLHHRLVSGTVSSDDGKTRHSRRRQQQRYTLGRRKRIGSSFKARDFRSKPELQKKAQYCKLRHTTGKNLLSTHTGRARRYSADGKSHGEMWGTPSGSLDDSSTSSLFSKLLSKERSVRLSKLHGFSKSSVGGRKSSPVHRKDDIQMKRDPRKYGPKKAESGDSSETHFVDNRGRHGKDKLPCTKEDKAGINPPVHTSGRSELRNKHPPSSSSSSWLSTLLSESDRKLNEIDKEIDVVLREKCSMALRSHTPSPYLLSGNKDQSEKLVKGLISKSQSEHEGGKRVVSEGIVNDQESTKMDKKPEEDEVGTSDELTWSYAESSDAENKTVSKVKKLKPGEDVDKTIPTPDETAMSQEKKSHTDLSYEDKKVNILKVMQDSAILSCAYTHAAQMYPHYRVNLFGQEQEHSLQQESEVSRGSVSQGIERKPISGLARDTIPSSKSLVQEERHTSYSPRQDAVMSSTKPGKQPKKSSLRSSGKSLDSQSAKPQKDLFDQLWKVEKTKALVEKSSAPAKKFGGGVTFSDSVVVIPHSEKSSEILDHMHKQSQGYSETSKSPEVSSKKKDMGGKTDGVTKSLTKVMDQTQGKVQIQDASSGSTSKSDSCKTYTVLTDGLAKSIGTSGAAHKTDLSRADMLRCSPVVAQTSPTLATDQQYDSKALTVSEYEPDSQEIQQKTLLSSSVGENTDQNLQLILDRQVDKFVDSMSWAITKDPTKIHIDWDRSKDKSSRKKEFEKAPMTQELGPLSSSLEENVYAHQILERQQESQVSHTLASTKPIMNLLEPSGHVKSMKEKLGRSEMSVKTKDVVTDSRNLVATVAIQDVDSLKDEHMKPGSADTVQKGKHSQNVSESLIPVTDSLSTPDSRLSWQTADSVVSSSKSFRGLESLQRLTGSQDTEFKSPDTFSTCSSDRSSKDPYGESRKHSQFPTSRTLVASKMEKIKYAASFTDHLKSSSESQLTVSDDSFSVVSEEEMPQQRLFGNKQSMGDTHSQPLWLRRKEYFTPESSDSSENLKSVLSLETSGAHESDMGQREKKYKDPKDETHTSSESFVSVDHSEMVPHVQLASKSKALSDAVSQQYMAKSADKQTTTSDLKIRGVTGAGMHRTGHTDGLDWGSAITEDSLKKEKTHKEIFKGIKSGKKLPDQQHKPHKTQSYDDEDDLTTYKSISYTGTEDSRQASNSSKSLQTSTVKSSVDDFKDIIDTPNSHYQHNIAGDTTHLGQESCSVKQTKETVVSIVSVYKENSICSSYSSVSSIITERVYKSPCSSSSVIAGVPAKDTPREPHKICGTMETWSGEPPLSAMVSSESDVQDELTTTLVDADHQIDIWRATDGHIDSSVSHCSVLNDQNATESTDTAGDNPSCGGKFFFIGQDVYEIGALDTFRIFSVSPISVNTSFSQDYSFEGESELENVPTSHHWPLGKSSQESTGAEYEFKNTIFAESVGKRVDESSSATSSDDSFLSGGHTKHGRDNFHPVVQMEGHLKSYSDRRTTTYSDTNVSDSEILERNERASQKHHYREYPQGQTTSIKNRADKTAAHSRKANIMSKTEMHEPHGTDVRGTKRHEVHNLSNETKDSKQKNREKRCSSQSLCQPVITKQLSRSQRPVTAPMSICARDGTNAEEAVASETDLSKVDDNNRVKTSPQRSSMLMPDKKLNLSHPKETAHISPCHSSAKEKKLFPRTVAETKPKREKSPLPKSREATAEVALTGTTRACESVDLIKIKSDIGREKKILVNTDSKEKKDVLPRLSRCDKASQQFSESEHDKMHRVSSELKESCETKTTSSVPLSKKDSVTSKSKVSHNLQSDTKGMESQELQLGTKGSGCSKLQAGARNKESPKLQSDVKDTQTHKLQLDVKDTQTHKLQSDVKDTQTHKLQSDVKDTQTHKLQSEVKDTQTHILQSDMKKIKTHKSQSDVKDTKSHKAQSDVKDTKSDKSQSDVKDTKSHKSQSDVKDTKSHKSQSEVKDTKSHKLQEVVKDIKSHKFQSEVKDAKSPKLQSSEGYLVSDMSLSKGTDSMLDFATVQEVTSSHCEPVTSQDMYQSLASSSLSLEVQNKCSPQKFLPGSPSSPVCYIAKASKLLPLGIKLDMTGKALTHQEPGTSRSETYRGKHVFKKLRCHVSSQQDSVSEESDDSRLVNKTARDQGLSSSSSSEDSVVPILIMGFNGDKQYSSCSCTSTEGLEFMQVTATSTDEVSGNYSERMPSSNDNFKEPVVFHHLPKAQAQDAGMCNVKSRDQSATYDTPEFGHCMAESSATTITSFDMTNTNTGLQSSSDGVQTHIQKNCLDVGPRSKNDSTGQLLKLSLDDKGLSSSDLKLGTDVSKYCSISENYLTMESSPMSSQQYIEGHQSGLYADSSDLTVVTALQREASYQCPKGEANLVRQSGEDSNVGGPEKTKKTDQIQYLSQTRLSPHLGHSSDFTIAETSVSYKSSAPPLLKSSIPVQFHSVTSYSTSSTFSSCCSSDSNASPCKQPHNTDSEPLNDKNFHSVIDADAEVHAASGQHTGNCLNINCSKLNSHSLGTEIRHASVSTASPLNRTGVPGVDTLRPSVTSSRDHGHNHLKVHGYTAYTLESPSRPEMPAVFEMSDSQESETTDGSSFSRSDASLDAYDRYALTSAPSSGAGRSSSVIRTSSLRGDFLCDNPRDGQATFGGLPRSMSAYPACVSRQSEGVRRQFSAQQWNYHSVNLHERHRTMCQSSHGENSRCTLHSEQHCSRLLNVSGHQEGVNLPETRQTEAERRGMSFIAKSPDKAHTSKSEDYQRHSSSVHQGATGERKDKIHGSIRRVLRTHYHNRSRSFSKRES